MFRPACTDLWASFLFSPQGLRVRPAPGIPCALCIWRDEDNASLGRNRAAGMRLLVIASEAKQSRLFPADAVWIASSLRSSQ